MQFQNVLGNLSPAEFLTGYWQKKPLLIRNAIPDYKPPLSADELAGLACSDDVESRIVIEKDGELPWELQHGPFEETAFTQLPESHWTLLVQECNKHVPELALLLDKFNFIPNWRVDDVMVSYAAPQGSVGPHVDQYDVFLLQGLGRRRWQINSRKSAHLEFIPNTDLRILNYFEADEEWILEPGDILYLPPGIAHYGVALEDCMTMSIGFRAPSHYELLTHFAEQQFHDISDPFLIPRYSDPGLDVADNCGEITESALQEIIATIQSYSNDKLRVQRWFGKFITEPRSESDFTASDTNFKPDQIRKMLATQTILCRSEYARFSFINMPDDSSYLYINGNEFFLNSNISALAPAICNLRRIEAASLQKYCEYSDALKLVCTLFNNGYLYLED